MPSPRNVLWCLACVPCTAVCPTGALFTPETNSADGARDGWPIVPFSYGGNQKGVRPTRVTPQYYSGTAFFPPVICNLGGVDSPVPSFEFNRGWRLKAGELILTVVCPVQTGLIQGFIGNLLEYLPCYYCFYQIVQRFKAG